MKNDKKIIISLVGVLIMLLLIISATYAYFSVTITGNGSKTMITANTPKKHSLSVSTLYDDIHIHVDNNDMKLANAGSYYGAVDKDNRYEKDLTTGTHNIIEVSSKGMENIRYSCSGDIKVTLNIDNGSMGNVLEKEDVLLYLKGLGLDEELDLSTLKVNNTKVYKTTFDIDGNSSDYLSAIVELINKESYQNYIANKILNVKIEAENMVCHENGTYKYLVKLNKPLTEKQNDTEVTKYIVSIFYDEEGLYQKIQNIYLVDYIDTTKAIKTWELGDTDRGTKSDEVMGWLEKTPNENDSYDLYIGSNGPMRAPQDMAYAFYNFTNLKKITSDALDTSEVTSMANLFNNDTNLIDISALSNWNTQNVTNMNSVFSGCNKLSNITALANWDVSNVTSMSSLFGGTNISNISPLLNWDTKNVKDIRWMFDNVSTLTDISALEHWNTSKVINMAQTFNATQISDLTPLSNWDVSTVQNTGSMFSNTPISDLTPLSNWDLSSLIYMGSMFQSCKNLSDISPIANWDTKTVTDMYSLFNNTKIFDLTPISKWNMSNVTSIAGMFSNTPISDLSPIANWDIPKVTNMSNLFLNCSQLTNITPLANWDVSKVTNISNMFSGLRISDFSAISNWDTKNVTNISGMFGNTPISDLTPLSKWDVSKVTDMSTMFQNCPNLTDISPIANWNVFSLTTTGNKIYGGMFQNCSSLTKIDLSKWKAPKLENIDRMFALCTKLVELKLPEAPYNKITNKINYQAVFGGEYDGYFGIAQITSVADNISITVDATQESWIKARLVEAGVSNATINGKPMSSVS